MSIRIEVDSEHVENALARMSKGGKILADNFVHKVLSRVKEGLARYGSSVDGVDYNGDAEIVMIPGSASSSFGVLVVSSGLRRLSVKDAWTTVLYPSLVPKDDKESALIRSKAPWIPEMLPARITAPQSGYKWSHRKISVQESDQLLYKAVADDKIRGALMAWGIVPVSASAGDAIEIVRDRVFPDGLESREDLAWRVIRQEYGLYGESSVPHWRRAISFAKDSMFEDLESSIEAWADPEGQASYSADADVKNALKDIAAFEKAIAGGVQ